MSKRRKSYWSIYNRPGRKHRRTTPDVGRFPHDTKTIFKTVCGEIEYNSGKALNEHTSRGFYYHVQRTRGEDQAYFIVRRKGNNLIAYKKVHLINGKPENLYMLQLGMGPQDGEVYSVRVEEILRRPIKQYREFIQAFKAATPELNWFDDDDDQEEAA